MSPGEGNSRQRRVPLTVVIGSDTKEDRVVSMEIFSSAIEARRYHRVVKRQEADRLYLVLRATIMDYVDEKLLSGLPLWIVVLSDGAIPKKLAVYLHEINAAQYEIPLRHKNVNRFSGKIHVAAWPCLLDRAVVPPSPDE